MKPAMPGDRRDAAYAAPVSVGRLPCNRLFLICNGRPTRAGHRSPIERGGYGISQADAVKESIELSARARTLSGNLSYGEQKLLDLAG